ncbi:MAG: HAMP domain-containing histidine kinase [Oceanospirillales bacterium]|nr:HAMP domain-containing histidine kinase [Oceanospirillales bacterium]MBR9888518.1 HAMP domain-containing histidine kinase [Oceanospirillales bacterium]
MDYKVYMKWRAFKKYRLHFFILLITILLVVTFFLYLKIADKSDAAVESVEENLLWSVHQLEKDSYNVNVATEFLKLEPDNTKRIDVLKLNFDILYSRIDLFKKQGFGQMIFDSPVLNKKLDTMDELVKKLDSLIFGSGNSLDIEKIELLSGTLHNLSNDFILSSLEKAASRKVERREYQSDLYNYFVLLVAFIFISFIVMVFLMFRQLIDIRSERKRSVIFAKRLRDKTHEAKRSSKAKTDFLSRMSHELRTPLNIIIGFGQLLRCEEDLNPLSRQNVDEILGAGDHLLTLVNEVLELSRIEAGVLDVNIEAVSLSEFLNKGISKYTPLAEKRDIDINIEPLPENTLVKADPVRLNQVISNLLSNAIKYNRDGGKIVLSAERCNENRLRISVADTGKGIEDHHLKLLFQPFERLESPYDGIEGTGIGLAITKRLVEAMNGMIGVDSTPPDGSVFWFELELVG